MDISRSYSVVISGATSLPKKTLQNTVDCYRRAVGYFIDVILANWDDKFTSDMTQVKFVKVAEELCIPSNKHVNATYDFPKADQSFNRFPSYLRRAAITAAFGKVKAYQSLKFKWDHEAHKKGLILQVNQTLVNASLLSTAKICLRVDCGLIIVICSKLIIQT